MSQERTDTKSPLLARVDCVGVVSLLVRQTTKQAELLTRK